MYVFKVWYEEDDFSEPRTMKGEEFVEFLNLCFKESTFFSLNKAVWTSCVDMSLQKELEPFLVKRLETFQWFGYDLSLAPEGDKKKLTVNIYKAEAEAKEILLKYFYDIFLTQIQDGVVIDSVQTLEDLCFFTKNEILVGTVSHESLLEVFPCSEEFKQKINKFGKWNYREKDMPIRIEV